MTSVGPATERGPVERGLAAEFRRARGDALPWVFPPLALLSAVSLVLSLPSDLRAAPTSVVTAIGEEVSASAFSGLLLIAAVLGALGVALADRGGVLARELLFAPPAIVFGARALSTVIVGLVLGALGVLLVEAAFLAVSGAVLLPLPVAAGATLALAGVGLWGYLVGLLVRNPILVLFVVPATLMPGVLLAEVAPVVASVLPMSALLSAAGVSGGQLDGAEAAVVAAAWILALALVAALVVRRRDRL